MRLLYIVCEGPTEEEFVNEVLRQALPSELNLRPILIGPTGKRGGHVSFDRALDSILRLAKQCNGAVTTLFDLYGLGEGWPERPFTCEEMERALTDAMLRAMGHSWNPTSFRAHIQPYEFEGLLFSDPAAMARGMGREDLEGHFRSIREAFPSPEAINNSRVTSPSHRIEALVKGYQKPFQGNLAALEVGVEVMIRECPHFAGWVEWLRTLPTGNAE